MSLATTSGAGQSRHWMARNSNWLSGGHHTWGESRTRLAALTGSPGKTPRRLGGQRVATCSREHRVCYIRVSGSLIGRADQRSRARPAVPPGRYRRQLAMRLSPHAGGSRMRHVAPSNSQGKIPRQLRSQRVATYSRGHSVGSTRLSTLTHRQTLHSPVCIARGATGSTLSYRQSVTQLSLYSPSITSGEATSSR